MFQDALGSKLIAPHPNTYTYTKRLAEILVRSEYKNLPICICRPSVVTPAYKEPMPGWVDSLNGPVGITVAACKGLLYSIVVNKKTIAEVIPVDKAIAGLIIAAFKVGNMKIK